MLVPICNAYTFQKEMGENGTPHYQGYVRFMKKTTVPSKLVPVPAHWLRCDQNYEKYCSKEETRIDGPWVLAPSGGVRRGKRTDMDEAAQMLKSGSTMVEVAELYPSQVVRYQQHFKRFQSLSSCSFGRSSSSFIHGETWNWKDSGSLFYRSFSVCPTCGKRSLVRQLYGSKYGAHRRFCGECWVNPVAPNFRSLSGSGACQRWFCMVVSECYHNYNECPFRAMV